MANRRRDTTPELSVQKEIFARGLRYRVDFPLPMAPRRRADIMFPRQKVAVFIDGCFWHGCPRHYSAPQRNREFWARKVAGNRCRDRETTLILEANGWISLRYWAHVDRKEAADAIEAVVASLQLSQASA